MITVTELSRNYASVWKRTFPFLSRIVRKSNLQKESFKDQIISDVEPSRRALVNEFGFRLFAKMHELQISNIGNIDETTIENISEKTCKYIAGLERSKSIDKPNEVERKEAILIANRTWQFFNDYIKHSNLVVSPEFTGCGMVSSCFGDVLSGDTLYEIKAGDREFRVSDLKQLFVYTTLNFANHDETIKYIALINPRLGDFVKMGIKESVEIASGKAAADAFYEIINFFDNPDDFR